MRKRRHLVEIPFVQEYLNIVKKFTKKFPVLNALILAVGLVLMWRGLSIFFDLYIFPNNELLSAVVSLLVGFILLYYNDLKLNELV